MTTHIDSTRPSQLEAEIGLKSLRLRSKWPQRWGNNNDGDPDDSETRLFSKESQ